MTEGPVAPSPAEPTAMIGANLVRNYFSVEEDKEGKEGDDVYRNHGSNKRAKGDGDGAPSLLRSVSRSLARVRPRARRRDRFLLFGPSGCGAPDLAMDRALSIASRGSSSSGVDDDDDRVAFLIPARHRRERFPTPCRPRRRNDDDGEEQRRDVVVADERRAASERFARRMRELNRHEAEERRRAAAVVVGDDDDDEPGRRRRRDENYDDDDDASMLRRRRRLERIHVHYLSDLSELLRYSASIPSLPATIRPTGGVVVEGLHSYARDAATDDADAMALSRALALLSNAADRAERSRKRRDRDDDSSFVIVATWDDSVAPAPPNLRRALADATSWSTLVAEPTNEERREPPRRPRRWRLSLEETAHDELRASGAVRHSNNGFRLDRTVVATYEIRERNDRDNEHSVHNNGRGGTAQEELVWSLNDSLSERR